MQQTNTKLISSLKNRQIERNDHVRVNHNGVWIDFYFQEGSEMKQRMLNKQKL